MLHITYDGDQCFTIHDRTHTIRVESPARPEDYGSAPAVIFSGAVGACIGYYVLAYFRKHDLDPTGLRMDVGHSSAEHPHRIGSIATRIILPPHIGEEHYPGILANAKRCLLHQTLLNPPELPIEIVPTKE
jgi:putative redox protein